MQSINWLRSTPGTLAMMGLLLLAAAGVAQANNVAFTDAVQGVGSGSGYKDAQDIEHETMVRNPTYAGFDPWTGLGLEDANLTASNGDSAWASNSSASLVSDFEDDYFSITGNAQISNEWLAPPAGSTEIFGGGGGFFHVAFDAEADGTMQMSGTLATTDTTDSESGMEPPYVRLFRLDGNGEADLTLFDVTLATPGQADLTAAIPLVNGTSYRLEAWYMAGSYADAQSPGPNVGTSSLDLSATFVPEPATLAMLALGGMALLRRRAA